MTKQCPLCCKKFIATFKRQEKKQKGKNMWCPHCNKLLWVPPYEKPQPVIQKAYISFTEKTPTIPLSENYHYLSSRKKK